jgi:tRNA-specific 2-thiouridylase
MYSDAVVRFALDTTRGGSAGPEACAGEAGDEACGDRVHVELAVAGGRIVRARHRSRACPHATAGAALVCSLAEGRELLDAARIGASEIDAGLLPDAGGRECALLAVDALHTALAGALERWQLPPQEGRVAVAMSGGVDSAVALLKTVEAGFEPVGVTLRLWIDPEAPDSERACCSPQSVRAARSACHALGVPHLTLDLRRPFREQVVEAFVRDHAAGLTPNPCVRCNGRFRFEALATLAEQVGAPRLATGHYARTVRRQGRTLLARGLDETKDQSYMLATVPPRILERVWFPLGEQRKTTTREQARHAGLAAAGRAESQEVCFVGGGDHRAFLERHGGAGKAGAIVDSEGRELGRHDGVHRFTAGQRRGLRVGGGDALYVISTDAATGTVVAGRRGQLRTTAVRVSPGTLHTAPGRVSVKLRYRSPAVEATVVAEPGGFRLELAQPVPGAAPGQAAVLYEGDVVVGAGIITA